MLLYLLSTLVQKSSDIRINNYTKYNTLVCSCPTPSVARNCRSRWKGFAHYDMTMRFCVSVGKIPLLSVSFLVNNTGVFRDSQPVLRTLDKISHSNISDASQDFHSLRISFKNEIKIKRLPYFHGTTRETLNKVVNWFLLSLAPYCTRVPIPAYTFLNVRAKTSLNFVKSILSRYGLRWLVIWVNKKV